MAAVPKVAIVGGGPAGLLLARLLQVRGVPSKLYELETSPNVRSQGGSLDLSKDGGQKGLKEAGLFEEFQKHARPEGETLRILDPSGKTLLDESRADETERRPQGEFQDRPEIDRNELREMLLDSLDADVIQWGLKVTGVEPTKPGEARYMVKLASGASHGPYDLVVGGDGTWSAVRPILTDVRPHYSGVGGLDLKYTDANTKYPETAHRVGEGMCLMLGNRKGLMAQKSGDGSVRCYAFVREPQEKYMHLEDTRGKAVADPAKVKQFMLDNFYAEYSQELRKGVVVSDDETYVRPMWMLPIGHTWEHKAGVTLIGDAAHVMSPFAGVGVNAGMQDSLELADMIQAQRSKWTSKETMREALAESLKNYEVSMWARAKNYSELTWMYLNLFFHERGGHALVDHFRAEREKEAATKAAEAKA